jgi:hypothetical protein
MLSTVCAHSVRVYSPQSTACYYYTHMHAQIRIVSGNDRWEFGRAQIILRAQNGVLWAGTDGRADGTAIAW